MIKRGFTLIEILVVIAIIGILATVILVSVNGAKEKANDAKEISNLKQVQNVLEVYHATNGVYFTGTCAPFGSGSYDFEYSLGGITVCTNCSEYNSDDPNVFLSFLFAGGYMTQNQAEGMFGQETSDTGANFLRTCYYYRASDRSKYKFISIINSAQKMANDGGTSPSYYEVGSDLSIPFHDIPSLYK